MIRTLILAAALGLPALSALAQATEEQKLALRAAIEANGWRVSAENNSAILGAAGLAEADAATVVQALLEAGEALIENGELLLKTENCP